MEFKLIPIKSFSARLFIIPVVIFCITVQSSHGTQFENDTTRIVILGVEHAGQLFVEDYRPAVVRSWLERVQPDVIAVERHPDAYTRNDFYGFTYEITDIVIPWAETVRISIHPFDWEPSSEDARLAFGFDLQNTPFLRPDEGGWGAFINFTPQQLQNMKLFMGEDDKLRERVDNWAYHRIEHNQAEAARRLFLFRTLLQARQLEAVATRYPGATIVVIVGYMHQPDLERFLKLNPHIKIIPASEFGHPSQNEIVNAEQQRDRIAIAWTGLFSMQSSRHPVDIPWLTREVGALQHELEIFEFEVLKTRLREYKGNGNSSEWLETWLELAENIPEGVKPSWTGLVRQNRIDSDFDPFAALSLYARALHEASRVAAADGREKLALKLRDQVVDTLPLPQRQQYLGYWDLYIK